MTASDAPIVVPLDGSKIAENAVPFAAYLAKLYDDCSVHFLHVADPDVVKTTDDLTRAQETFASYALQLSETHHVRNPVIHVAEGGPAEAILRYKWEHAARYVVMATHGRGGFQSLFIGSVTDKVTRSSRLPVIAVPGVEEPPVPGKGPVLVALDGSPEAEQALEVGRDLAARMNVDLYLVRAYSVPPPIGVEFSYYSPDVLDSFKQAATEYLDSIAREGEHKIVVQAAPAVAVEEAANRHDSGLIALASSGKGLAKRLALGSTTSRVMHSVHRPILVVPPEDR
ncbi:MAG: universal stress protein [Dehalococcoidia bacterium]|nr:universal stress protein [Dehalococcoidia bacterium]